MSNPKNDLLQQLQAVYARRGAANTAIRKSLLRQIRRLPLTSASFITTYHDLLLFILAFPDDAEIHRLAQSEIRRIAQAAKLSGETSNKLSERLRDSGIAFSAIDYAFSAPIAAWLSETFGVDVEVDWHAEANVAMLESFGHIFVPHMEQDSLLAARDSIREIFETLTGPSCPTVLAWLLGRYKEMNLPEVAHIEFFNLLDVCLHWRLVDPRASRTLVRLPRRRLSRRSAQAWNKTQFARHIETSLPKQETLSREQSLQLIDVARATLCARQRETEATTHPNLQEVFLFRLEGGIDVVIYGMAPSRRLAIESFFGVLAASNGVPIAYGGGFVFCDRLEMGLNIFREFRGGDSAFAYAQILRVFCQHFDSKRIVIDSAQFGYGRRGGISSGAFWFYYKLGFRPVDPKLASLAASEAQQISSEPEYRTPARTLSRFTASDLVFLRPGADVPPPPTPRLGLAISHHATTHHNGDREAAAVAAQRRVRRLLGIDATQHWPAEERRSFLRMCSLVALLDDLGEWPASAKRSLVALMRAKGGPKERRYTQLMRRHKRFVNALATLAKD